MPRGTKSNWRMAKKEGRKSAVTLDKVESARERFLEFARNKATRKPTLKRSGRGDYHGVGEVSRREGEQG